VTSATLIDIAREAGVSFKTVSRVINGDPKVRAETRERVEGVVARLNYRPNVWARALASSRSHLLALIYDNPSPGYIGQVQVGAMTACQRAGYHLIIEEVKCQSEDVERRIREVVSLRLDGVVLSAPACDSVAVLETLRKAKMPFVRIAPHEHLDLSPYVHMDDYKAAYEMTAYLRSMGHRDIAFIRGPSNHAQAEDRYRGFLAAMEKLDGNIRSQWVAIGGFTARSGMAAGEKLLSTRPAPTAIFASNDDMAVGAMSAAFRRGLALPGDLSIAGFDDSPIAGALWPQLTTVRQPTAEMADGATEMLIQDLNKPGAAKSRLVGFEIVKRDSVVRLVNKRLNGKRQR
jgi:LacI family transcriptional regulator